MQKKACGICAVKGGVGKTLITLNIANQLSKLGSVALIDCDVDNSNFQQFTGINRRIEITKNHQFKPYDWNGIQVFSMSLLVGGEKSVSMPGDRYVQIIDDVIERSLWDADFFLFDLPGEASNIFRSVMELTAEYSIGNIVVCQPAMVQSTKKTLNLHRYLEIPVLGVIENMSYLQAGAIKYYPFGKSTVDEVVSEFQVPVLGKIPLSLKIAENIKQGKPFFEEKEALEPIELACQRISSAKIQRPGFLTRIKEKVTKTLKAEVEKIMVGILVSLNKNFDVEGLRMSTGFTEQHPFLFVITDESGTKEITRVALRATKDGIKVLEDPEDLDFQIATDFTTLARMIFGKAKRGDSLVDFNAMDAFLNGDLKAFGIGYSPRAIRVFREIFGNDEIMKPIRERYSGILERWL